MTGLGSRVTGSYDPNLPYPLPMIPWCLIPTCPYCCCQYCSAWTLELGVTGREVTGRRELTFSYELLARKVNYSVIAGVPLMFYFLFFAIVVAHLHLYFEENVGLGNQLLSLASVIYLRDLFYPFYRISTTSNLRFLLNFNSTKIYIASDCCHIDASHEMTQDDMDDLFNVKKRLINCECIEIKGGQYFLPHLKVNQEAKNDKRRFKDIISPLLPVINTPIEFSQAVHLRYFSNEHEPYADHLLSRTIEPKQPLYISSLFPHTAQYILRKFSQDMIIYQVHINGKQMYGEVEHDRQALIDILMLARAKQVLFLSPGSTFSYVSAALSTCPRVFFLSRGRLLPKPLIDTSHNRYL